MSSPRHNLTAILLLLGALCVVTPFAIDMYLPGFAAIAAEFHTSTSQISLSLSTYFVGFAIGQMLYGPLLDRYGRKRPLYCGLAVYILASIGCALAPSLHALVAFRFLEALGGCVAQVAAIAMVRDFFPVNQSARVFSLLFLMIGTSPLLAPTAGSFIVASLSWRWIFAVLATIAVIILALVFTLLPEGHQPDPTVILLPAPMLRSFMNIARNPQFLVYSLAGAFSFAGLFAFVAGSPLIFMDGYHLSTRAFGMVFAVTVMGFIGGNQLNVLVLRWYSSQQVFLAALAIQLAIGIAFYAGMRSQLLGLPGTMVLSFLFLSCIGLTYPNAAAIGLAPFSSDAGRASALLGFLQNGTGSLISMGIGVLGLHALMALFALAPVVAVAILLAGRRFVSHPVETESTVIVH